MYNGVKKVDLGKLDMSIQYIERITDGYHPIHNRPLRDEDALNDPVMIRCMYFIKDILETVRQNEGYISMRKGKAVAVPFPEEILDEFQYIEDKSIMHLMRQIHEPVKELNVKKVSFMKVTSWLKEDGYLVEEEEPGTGKTRKIPTEEGKKLGIYLREREYEGRVYETVMYDKNAQEYIVERIRSELKNHIV